MMSGKRNKNNSDNSNEVVPAAFSTSEVINAIQAYQPDLILVNASNASSEQFELLHTARAQFQGPILYIVDRQGEEKLQRARIDGPFCFIHPAINPNTLRNTVEMAFYKYKPLNLTENEKRYQIISEMVSDSAFSVNVNPDHSVNLDWVSDNFENLSGFTIEDFMRVGGWQAIIHPQDYAAFEQTINTLKNGKPACGEFRFYNKAGLLIWIQFYGQPGISAGTSQVKRIYCAVRNITRFKLTKEILTRDQEELRFLFNNAPIGMAITSLDYHLNSVNTTFCSMTGYTYRELINMLITDLTHSQDRKEETRRFKGLLEGQYSSFELEKRIITRSGKELHVNMHASLIRDQYDAPLYYITQYVDITRQKTNEKALEESYITFATVLDSLDAYVTVIDNETDQIILANQKTTNAFGDVRGKKCWQALPGHSTWPCTYCNPELLLLPNNQPAEPIIEEDFYNKINAWVEVRLQAMRWIDDRIVRLEIATDITRRKRMEVEMQLLNGSLSASLLAMEEHNRQITLINKLSESLQRISTISQAYPFIAQTCQQLFRDHPGALWTHLSEEQAFTLTCQWGNSSHLSNNTEIKKCPALNDKKTILFLEESTTSIPCLSCTLHDTPGNPFICTPLIDGDIIFGLLHFEFDHPTLPQSAEKIAVDMSNPSAYQLSLREWEDMVLTVSSQIMLSLTNIRLKERLQIEAIRDPLTGLYNRRYMEESFEHEFSRAQRHNYSVGVIMLDIDHFKTFNDRYGHLFGDAILKQLAVHIMSQFRSEDITCRYGGDEFVIILPEASLEETFRRANDLNISARYISIEQEHFEQELTISIGIAVFPIHGNKKEDILRAADNALYQAKIAGRNRVKIAKNIP
jgi:diguanylate cyclase (GGDEF)-like protein/PAS domain S-box-containing protein